LSVTITNVVARDVRFPTSGDLSGSDAMNPDPDYSAAYVILETDEPGLEGHGLTFTRGFRRHPAFSLVPEPVSRAELHGRVRLYGERSSSDHGPKGFEGG
jgi:hypothetical protein